MAGTITGKCLCGAVQYQTEAQIMMTGHCFCEHCRRSSGTSHCTHVVIPAEGFNLTGVLKFFDKPADSGNIVSRGFCPECGSAVLSKNSAEMFAGMVFLRASSLDDMNLASPEMSVYAGRAPNWALVDRDHPVFEGEFPGLAEGNMPI